MNTRKFNSIEELNNSIKAGLELEPDLGNLEVTEGNKTMLVQLELNYEKALYPSDDLYVWYINSKYGANEDELISELKAAAELIEEEEWSVSDSDIEMALQECCLPNGEEDVKEVYTYLDQERVAVAASKGVSIEDKSNLAQEDIFAQIREQ